MDALESASILGRGAAILVAGFLVSCGAQPLAAPHTPEARPATSVANVPPPAVPRPSAAAGQAHAAAQHAAPARWDARWKVVSAFHGATSVFETTMDLCAALPAGVRCLGSTKLGPLATTAVTSPTGVWGFVWICGIARDHSFVCNAPPAARPQVGPPRLASVTSADIHAAAHVDGTLSVTTNKDAIGYADPKWATVRAVKDAVQVASSFYDTKTCYLERDGGVACVDRSTNAVPKPVTGVRDAKRIWKTDHALWVLTRAGALLATHDPGRPLQPVAEHVVDVAPNVPVLAAKPPDADIGDVPCAVRRDGHLVCGLGGSWKLVPVPGAGTTRRIFGGSDWACAVDDAQVVRCLRKPTT